MLSLLRPGVSRETAVLLTSQSISVSHSLVPDEDLHVQNIALLQSTELREMTSLVPFKALAMSLCDIVLRILLWISAYRTYGGGW